jgi:hypothetical protein
MLFIRHINKFEDQLFKGGSVFIVEWYGRNGNFHTDLQKEAKAFNTKQEAEQFKKALERAFKFIRYTHENPIIIRKS